MRSTSSISVGATCQCTFFLLYTEFYLVSFHSYHAYISYTIILTQQPHLFNFLAFPTKKTRQFVSCGTYRGAKWLAWQTSTLQRRELEAKSGGAVGSRVWTRWSWTIHWNLGNLGGYMGVEPKIGFFYPPNHPFVHRVFHEINHPFWGSIIFGNTLITFCWKLRRVFWKL